MRYGAWGMSTRPFCLALLPFAVACSGTAAHDDSPDATTPDASAALDAWTGDAGSDANGCANDDHLAPACQPAQQDDVLLQMKQAPITLPNHAALLDLYPCDAGITLAQATYVLCAPTPEGSASGDDAGTFVWGDGVVLQFGPASGVRERLELIDYAGTLSFESADHRSSYVIQLDAQVMKNGAPFSITGPATDGGVDGGLYAASSAAFDELYRALVSTFAPSIALDPEGTTCVSTEKCTLTVLPDIISFSVMALGVTIWSQSIPIVTEIDLDAIPPP